MLFEDEIFNPQSLNDERTIDILLSATERAADQVRPSDILYAAIAGGDRNILSILTVTLAEGARPPDLLDGIDLFNPARPSGPRFDGKRERFTTEARAALDEFDAGVTKLAADLRRLREIGLELLIACVLSHLDEEERRFLGILDVDRAGRALFERVRISGEPLPPLLDDVSNRLRSEEFSADAWATLENAAERAAELGYDRLLPPHCFLALLGETEGLLEHLIRLQIPPHVGTAKVTEAVTAAFRRSDRTHDPIPLHRDALGDALLGLLERARRAAVTWGADRVDTAHLLSALLEDPPARLASVLQAEPLSVHLSRLREHLDQALREARATAPREVALRLPAGLPSGEDLTWLARTEQITPALHIDRYFEPLTRALHRRTGNHVLITGLPGVGTTTLLRELARRAATGEISFLRRKRFLRVDCRDVPTASSRAALAKIIDHVAGRTDVIVCLDGLGSLLRGEGGTDHRLLLRSALKERRIHLIGVLSGNDYDDLLAVDHDLLELTTRIEVTEPDRPATLDMVRQAALASGIEISRTVTDHAVERAVILSADYIVNERLPLKAVKVLRRACEDLHYRRTQLGSDQESLDIDDVVQVIAEISGVPASQISGAGDNSIDLEQTLSESVVGQPEAVRLVARELRRIKAGLAGSGRQPAAVMFFAGLTGVGKTELAKTIARFYSTSKRLQTYPMENFTEPHSVAGIIGSPPGYVGHDQGGRLINDLNADPYCVFLLDEAEKAHPDVWRPFLNLFDEGWIVDQRGVKAFGDRAVFVLTSNAGHEVIAQMSKEGRPAAEVTDAVENALRGLRNRQSGGPVFPPEFLARIGRIIVFRPLDRTAMEGICRRVLDERRRWWRDQREKELVVPEALIRYIAGRSHAANTAAGGNRGGRVVRRMISDLIEDAVTLAGERTPEDFRACARIELRFHPTADGGSAGSEPHIDVVFARETA